MSYTVPYSFIPGTKARAQEVNANFNALIEYCSAFDTGKMNTDLSNISSDGIALIKNNTSLRNLGEIIFSTLPLNDSGLHLLDGSELSGTGIYENFVNFMTDLYENNPDSSYFITENDWQSAVETYGECGKFVYTPSSGSTPAKVRLPKISGIVEFTIDTTAIGDLVDAGLPNITGDFTGWGLTRTDTYSSSSGAITHTSVNYGLGSNNYIVESSTQSKIVFDASDSNSIYGKSETVQPQTVKYLIYIVIANVPKTDIQVDIDNIASDLNNKCDKDLSNISPSSSAKATIVGWAMPDYSNAISITSPFTAPSAGYIRMLHNANQSQGCTVDSFYVDSAPNASQNTDSGYPIIPVAKNSVYAGNTTDAYFIPCKGVN